LSQIEPARIPITVATAGTGVSAGGGQIENSPISRNLSGEAKPLAGVRTRFQATGLMIIS
jgi:hypothetical protein